MNESEPGQMGAMRIHSLTNVGVLALTVADLERSVAFYRDLIGLRTIQRDGGEAVMGVEDEPILILHEKPGAAEWPRGGRSFVGLYHFAILLPTRTGLGQWLAHWLKKNMPLPGQGDHLVSEALYLEDPDGHGIEIYRDRPRDEWQWDGGQVRMAVDPVDVRGLLEAAEQAGEPWRGMPSGTTLGHIHLQVSDIAETAQFYRDILGFDIVARMPSALFMSAGGYHHHIGANIWHSSKAGPAPDDTVSLKHFTVDLPDSDARDAVLERVKAAGIDVAWRDEDAVVHDPSGIQLLVRMR